VRILVAELATIRHTAAPQFPDQPRGICWAILHAEYLIFGHHQALLLQALLVQPSGWFLYGKINIKI
jgi:hypothetical protein